VSRVADGEVVVLSGAGLSTESGIPDYRGPSGRARPATPMTYQDFVGSLEARQRYWARSHLGWRAIVQADPNAGHRAVAQLQRAGSLAGVITQNVDGLHQAAGTREVIELHGALDRVICLNCGQTSSRAELDRRLQEANRDWLGQLAESDQIKPDGDVDLDPDLVSSFTVVGCLNCDIGPLKPDVVFFGENVPKDRVARAYGWVDDMAASSGALLVAGSSLTVMSGLRFVRHAHKHGVPVVIVNRGITRGDELAATRLDAGCSEVLTALAAPAGGAQRG
jgi:NAD-dependent SIR2 family protein deacetylase